MEKYKKILVCSIAVFASTLILGFIFFSTVVKFAVRDQTALRKRNEVRRYYEKLPFPLDFCVYFFNVTNMLEVQKGAVPNLTEVGPYCYNAFKEKIEIVDNSGDDSLTYTPLETYFYNDDKTYPLNENDYVTVVHPLIAGMVYSVSSSSPALLKVVDKALSIIFDNPKTIYLTVKVRDILFDGIPINCTSKDFSVKAVCSQLKMQVPGLIEVEKELYLFSLLARINGTLPRRIKVLRGIRKSRDLGRVVEYNGKEIMDIWGSKECNQYHGTDSWIFPPYVDKQEGVWAFNPDLCRNVHLKFFEESTFHGVKTEVFHGDFGDMSTIPADKCYCPKVCLKKGVIDLTKCMGVPIFASLPHFLKCHKSYLNGVIGLKPNLDNHTIRITLEPMTGTPLEGKKRVQFSLVIQKVNKIALMAGVPNVLHPLLWLEESVELEGKFLRKVTNVFMLLDVVKGMKWFILIVSLGGLLFSAFLFYNRLNKTTPILKIVNTQNSDISTKVGNGWENQTQKI